MYKPDNIMHTSN